MTGFVVGTINQSFLMRPVWSSPLLWVLNVLSCQVKVNSCCEIMSCWVSRSNAFESWRSLALSITHRLTCMILQKTLDFTNSSRTLVIYHGCSPSLTDHDHDLVVVYHVLLLKGLLWLSYLKSSNHVKWIWIWKGVDHREVQSLLMGSERIMPVLLHGYPRFQLYFYRIITRWLPIATGLNKHGKSLSIMGIHLTRIGSSRSSLQGLPDWPFHTSHSRIPTRFLFFRHSSSDWAIYRIQVCHASNSAVTEFTSCWHIIWRCFEKALQALCQAIWAFWGFPCDWICWESATSSCNS